MPTAMISDEQVEAAARAMCLHRKPKHPSLDDPKVCERYWQTHGSRRLYLDLARVALEAAMTGQPGRSGGPGENSGGVRLAI